MDVNRKTAYQALTEIIDGGAYSNIAVNRVVRKNGPGSESFVRGLVYGTLENRILIDYILEQYVASGLKKVKAPALRILEMGIYQILFMDSVPDYAAINESVSLAGKFCPGLKGFVNGVLRNFVRQGKGYSLPDPDREPAEYLSVKYSYHRSVVELWLRELGEEETEKNLQWGNRVPPLYIRVNSLKTDRTRLAEELRKKNFEVEDYQASPLVLSVKGNGLLETEAYAKGLFSVQDLSGVIAISAFAPGPGEKVVDVCGAPGGKSCMMAELMKDEGSVYAGDLYEHKLKLIRENAARLDLHIINAAERDAALPVPADSLLRNADRVLVDAPCSGLGVIRRKPEIKYRDCSGVIRELVQVQKKILEVSAELVRPGGTLMYSTCTYTQEENSGVTGDFLSSHPDFQKKEERQLTPGKDGTDAFYYCIMCKTKQS